MDLCSGVEQVSVPRTGFRFLQERLIAKWLYDNGVSVPRTGFRFLQVRDDRPPRILGKCFSPTHGIFASIHQLFQSALQCNSFSPANGIQIFARCNYVPVASASQRFSPANGIQIFARRQYRLLHLRVFRFSPANGIQIFASRVQDWN